MKTVNETFTDDEHDRLATVKGDRTWREAILEEFGVTETEVAMVEVQSP